MSNGLHQNILYFDGTEYNSMPQYNNEDRIFRSDVAFIPSLDREGNVFFKVMGEQPYDSHLMRWGNSTKFYVNLIDGEFIEYDSIRISVDDIERIDGGVEAMTEAQKYIATAPELDYQYGSLPYKSEIVDILYSGNDKVYINYELFYIPDESGIVGGGSTYTAARFDILDGKMIFNGFENGKRPLVSGKGLKSYTTPFPY